MKLKRITIEGMHNVERKSYDLQQFNYLYGLNGAGKSTVIEAIQLALLGYIPGTNKTNQAIFKHANGRRLCVILELENDGECIVIERTWVATKSTIVTDTVVTPTTYNLDQLTRSLELPVFNFDEFLGLTPNKLKDWFIEFLPDTNIFVDWPAELVKDLDVYDVDAFRHLVDDSIGVISKFQLSGIDEIREANRYFKDMVSYKKKELDRAQAAIQSLVFYDDVDTSISLEEIRSRIREYTESKLRAESALRILHNNDKIMEQLATFDDITANTVEEDSRYVTWRDRLDSYDKHLVELNSTQHDIQKQMSAMYGQQATIKAAAEVKQKIVDGNGVCPYTTTMCKDISALLSQYRQDISAAKDEIDQISKQITQLMIQLDVLSKSKSAIIDESNRIRSQQLELAHRYETKQFLQGQIQSVPELSEGVKDYDTLIANMQSLEAKVLANQKYASLIDTFTANKMTLEDEVAIYKSWVTLTGVNGLQSRCGETDPFANQAQCMDKYIHRFFDEHTRAMFNVETKANSFSFGICRQDKYIPYNLLSSGEKCMYSLALVMSLVEQSNSLLKLVLVDDSFDHLDDGNANKLFESLYQINDIQMIFAGVKHVNLEDAAHFVIAVEKPQ